MFKERRYSEKSRMIRPPTPPLGLTDIRTWLAGCVASNPNLIPVNTTAEEVAELATKIADDLLTSLKRTDPPSIPQPSEIEMQRWDDYLQLQKNIDKIRSDQPMNHDGFADPDAETLPPGVIKRAVTKQFKDLLPDPNKTGLPPAPPNTRYAIVNKKGHSIESIHPVKKAKRSRYNSK